MSWFNQNTFSYIIMALYIANAINFAYFHNYPNMFYWLFACGITASVTFR